MLPPVVYPDLCVGAEAHSLREQKGKLMFTHFYTHTHWRVPLQ